MQATDSAVLATRGSRVRGYLLVGGAAFCWGSSAALGRAVLTGRIPLAQSDVSRIDIVLLTQTRVTLAGLILLVALALRRRGRIGLPWRDVARAAALGLAGMTVSNYFYYLAIQRTNVATAIVLQYTAPIWVLAYLVARKRQRATPARVTAVVLAVIGIALAIGMWDAIHGGGVRLDAIGMGAATLAAFAFAFYNVYGEGLALRIDPLLIALYMQAGSALLWGFVNPPWRLLTAHYSEGTWGFLVAFSLVATLIPTVLYMSGLRFLDPTRAVVTSCLEPVAGIAWAALLLGETLDATRIAGVALVLAAIVFIQL